MVENRKGEGGRERRGSGEERGGVMQRERDGAVTTRNNPSSL